MAMTQLIVPKDVLPPIIRALRDECGRAMGAPVRVSSVLASDPGDGLTIHVYVAGGYPQSLVSTASILLLHCYAEDGPTAQRLAAVASAVVRNDRQEWHSGKVQSGPYDNPHPDYPGLHRYTVQCVVVSESERLDVD